MDRQSINARLDKIAQLKATAQSQKEAFFWLAIGVIAVSFVHIAAVVKFFSGESLIETIVAILLALIVDIYLALASWYIDSRKSQGRKVSGSVWAVTLLSLLVSLGMNLSYMVRFMPTEDLIPSWLAWPVAIGFSVLTTGIIWISSVISSEIGAMIQELNIEDDGLMRALLKPVVTELASNEENEQIEQPLFDSPTAQPALPLNRNAKSLILASDTEAILARIELNGGSFATYAELCELCGWSSSSTASKAVTRLRERGQLDLRDGRYVKVG